MKIVIASGKGGVGKSMLASALAMLFAQRRKVVAVDCDVDAPNLHLWLGEDEKWDRVEKISTSERAVIDLKKCNLCGKCIEICAFNALSISHRAAGIASGDARQSLVINHFFCEGCGACEVVCPQKAIKMRQVKNAEVRIKRDVCGFPLVSAQLYPGETGSGKVVDQIREKAEGFEYEVMVLDAPAGTGCPVIAAVNGADFAILITEPTPSGFSDLRRVLTVVKHFKVPYGVVVNKWDINPDKSSKIENWAFRQTQGKLLGKIAYDKRIFQAISDLRPIMETDLPVKKEIERVFAKLKRIQG
jgi:MinD superfamily P-loop ATPase